MENCSLIDQWHPNKEIEQINNDIEKRCLLCSCINKDQCMFKETETINLAQITINFGKEPLGLPMTSLRISYEDFLDLWHHIYPILDQISTIISLSGSTIGLGTWAIRKFKSKYNACEFIMILIQNEGWSSKELSDRLNISKEEAKNLLKAFGYKWDKSYQQYRKTELTDKLISNLKKHY